VKSTFDVRVYGILAYKGARGATYTVRWKVAGRVFRKPFATKALADSYRSNLLVAQRTGTAFDTASGLPEPEARKLHSRSWLTHAVAFVDVKWPHWSPKHRRNTADALTTATLSLITSERGMPAETAMREALYGWAFNKARRDAGDMPVAIQRTISWLTDNTVSVGDMDDAALMRKVLDGLALRMDGKAASASTVARKRVALSSALRYAVELRLLDSHPLDRVSWSAPKGNDSVDRRTVVNPTQARALLKAVRGVAPEFEAFFGCMYYSALRPEEVLHLREPEYQRPAEPGEWGWLNLTGATVTAGEAWSSDGGAQEDRALKHRAVSATRRVPVPPELVVLLDAHLDRHGTGPDGRLFVTQRGPGGRYRPTTGRPFSSNAYTRVWRSARRKALTEAQQASPLGEVPYSLRHAAVSLWLNAGVPATQVAEWAGHSVHVLMKVYAKCVDGQEDAARRRITAALKDG
jgi:integrase